MAFHRCLVSLQQKRASPHIKQKDCLNQKSDGIQQLLLNVPGLKKSQTNLLE